MTALGGEPTPEQALALAALRDAEWVETPIDPDDFHDRMDYAVPPPYDDGSFFGNRGVIRIPIDRDAFHAMAAGEPVYMRRPEPKESPVFRPSERVDRDGEIAELIERGEALTEESDQLDAYDDAEREADYRLLYGEEQL
jgi:hypothetical protein